ncbi:mannitol-1-phosphate dehydrogenase [Phellopilus nigrolimitatus]|nr:mannitol-1-phosphate dehydrogenase [Phellopilus nigrolimitatus]
MSQPFTIPKTQRAFVLPVVGGEIKLVDDHPVLPQSKLLPGQCLVKLTHTGVCHSDLGIKKSVFPNKPKPDLVGGHEGVGTVVAIGDHTTNRKVSVGDRVGIKYLGSACSTCELCLKGREGYCLEFKAHGNDYDGTFCEYAVAYIAYVTPIPEALESSAAAAIMCAGVTVYSALKQSDTHIGDWIVISGAGGGLGHLAIQYAVAMGLRVVAIDAGVAKRDLCLELGAEKWIDFLGSTNLVADVIRATEGGAHAALVAAGGSSAYETAVAYLRRTGTLLAVGLPPGAMISAPVLLVAARGLTIRGSFIGNRQETIEAVNIAAAGKVKCTYSIRGLSELNEVYEEMEKGQIAGRVVLDIYK